MKTLRFLPLALLAFGCHSASVNMVGTWTSGLGGALTTYHFRPDGTFTVENLYAGTHALIEGKYVVEGGKLALTPSKADVQGEGPEADHIRSVAMQQSRVTIKEISPNDFQLGLESPPLMVHRMSPNP